MLLLRLCRCCGYLEQMVAVQITMLLIQQHARPDIPFVGSLPGGSWPGMQEYILLMQVCRPDGPCSSSSVLMQRLGTVLSKLPI